MRSWISDHTEEVFVGGTIILIVLTVFFVGYLIVQEERAWKSFAEVHACKVVSKDAGSTAIGVGPVIGGSGGTVVTFTPVPGKTGYLCDDGVTYYR